MAKRMSASAKALLLAELQYVFEQAPAKFKTNKSALMPPVFLIPAPSSKPRSRSGGGRK